MDDQDNNARASEPTSRRHAPHVRDAATAGIGSGSRLPCHLHPEHRSMPGCLEPPHPSRTEEARRVRQPCATALAKFTADEPMPRRASTKWTDDFLSLAVPCCLPGDGAPQPARNLVCFALRAPG